MICQNLLWQLIVYGQFSKQNCLIFKFWEHLKFLRYKELNVFWFWANQDILRKSNIQTIFGKWKEPLVAASAHLPRGGRGSVGTSTSGQILNQTVASVKMLTSAWHIPSLWIHWRVSGSEVWHHFQMRRAKRLWKIPFSILGEQLSSCSTLLRTVLEVGGPIVIMTL